MGSSLLSSGGHEPGWVVAVILGIIVARGLPCWLAKMGLLSKNEAIRTRCREALEAMRARWPFGRAPRPPE